ncbi:hypothetical protein HHK36_015644 [Tetracentron sinense]|uniref:U-box domain-containing protein n=1 Tax=Tetracentron sinense TaxID=13715 RepID=A0A834Z1D3_TETSI|nr:hypothetical protein HHK36_015644 [Tetracentron sinense]
MEEDSMVESLFNGDRAVQIQAATDLSKLTTCKERNLFAERGVIPPLVSMLYSQDYEAIQAALFALLGLAFGSERNKIKITKFGAIPALVELLQCKKSRSPTELAIAALLMLSACRANKLTIAASGAIQFLVEILNRDKQRYSGGLQAKLDAIDTLHNLSTCHQVLPAIVSAGVVFYLLQLICRSDKSSKVAEKATALLEKIASLSETGRVEIAEADGGILALVETVEEGSQQSREHSVGVLLHICESCEDEYRGLILREGVMPGLLQLSVHGTRRAKDMARALLLLLRDFTNCDSSRQLENSVLKRIMEEIDAEKGNVNGTAMRLVEEMIAKLNT